MVFMVVCYLWALHCLASPRRRVAVLESHVTAALRAEAEAEAEAGGDGVGTRHHVGPTTCTGLSASIVFNNRERVIISSAHHYFEGV